MLYLVLQRLANLPATWCSFKIEENKSKDWISSRSWKI